MPVNTKRPRNRPNRASAMPAIVPRTTAMVAVIAAMRTDNQAARSICVSANSSPYQRADQPPQTVTKRLSLNENRTSSTIGTYKNSKPTASMNPEKPTRLMLDAPARGHTAIAPT
jgi:adenylate kinase family enzyme